MDRCGGTRAPGPGSPAVSDTSQQPRMSARENMRMISDAASEMSHQDELLLHLSAQMHADRQQFAATPFDTPISVDSGLQSPKVMEAMAQPAPPTQKHRLSVMTVEEYSSANGEDRVSKRKQSHPYRSMKQLASLADKIVNGVVVIEPRMPWEEAEQPGHTASAPAPKLPQRITIKPPIEPQPAERRKKTSTGGRSRSGDELKVALRSPVSETSRSPSPMLGDPGSPAGNPNSKPTSMIGKHCPSDHEPAQLAQRFDLYHAIYRKRRTSGSLAQLGSSRLSGFGGTPLDISQAPGASLLDEKEFELCSLLRLQPLQYFQSRATLLRNFMDRGYFKKSAAQKMLHIDVNKTGRLYDFFVKMGWMPEHEGGPFGEPGYIDWEQLLP